MLSETFFTKIVKVAFAFYLFLLPLVLTPWNYELFEYNKMIFTYVFTVIIVGAWLGKMIVSGQVKIQRTPLDIPIILYLLSCVLSTILSIHPHTSIWGYYSRFHGGLLSWFCYSLLYYAFVTNFEPKDVLYTIYIVLSSAFLVSFYGILEHFGIDAQYWVQDVKNRVFSTLGQPNWLGAFIDALIFIPLSMFLSSKIEAPRAKNPRILRSGFSISSCGLGSKLKSCLLLIAYCLLLLCLVFTNSKSAILAFWLGLISFLLLSLKYSKKSFEALGFVFLITLIIYLAFGQRTYHYLKKVNLWLKIFSSQSTLAPPPVNQEPKKPFISESSEIRKVVWKGALTIWKHYPWFGSGLETFAYSYDKFRPKEHNFLSEWDFLYNKAHNEFLNILACQGIIGLTTYLFLIGSFLWWSFRNIKISPYSLLISAFFSGYLTILITNFFGFSVVVTGLLFFLLPAFCFTLTQTYKGTAFTLEITGGKRLVKARPLQSLILIILLFALCFMLFAIINLWRADFYFNQGEKYYQNDYLVNSLIASQKAVELNPKEVLYHIQLAQTAAKLASLYHSTKEGDATSSAQLAGELKDLALKEVETTFKLNSVHLSFYKSAAKVYIYLTLFDPAFQNKALEVFLQAQKIAPHDPKILYNLALLSEKNEPQKAKEYLEKTLELKPDYQPAQKELKSLNVLE